MDESPPELTSFNSSWTRLNKQRRQTVKLIFIDACYAKGHAEHDRKLRIEFLHAVSLRACTLNYSIVCTSLFAVTSREVIKGHCVTIVPYPRDG